jgi:cobalt-zinc-cadmium efflux system membrane fusion protein
MTLSCCVASAAASAATGAVARTGVRVTRASATGASAAGTITARVQPVALQYQAYGRVQPITVLPITAGQGGVVSGLRVVPGSPVTAGEILATLTGPEIQALLVSREGALRSATTALAAARRALAGERAKLTAHLTTRAAVGAAESALATATADFQTAQVQLADAQSKSTLRAPSAGRVLALGAAEGERVAAGQTIVTLQTAGRLWLMASFYGADAAAIQLGMSGVFQPATGGAPVPVRVAAVGATIGPDGGEEVGLVSRDTGGWLNGEWGAVTITGDTRQMIPIPTEALILDQARWWVLVHTLQGDRAQPVVPGPTRGWQTFIADGLTPGQQIVVRNAYLEYHRGISASYTPPED